MPAERTEGRGPSLSVWTAFLTKWWASPADENPFFPEMERYALQDLENLSTSNLQLRAYNCLWGK